MIVDATYMIKQLKQNLHDKKYRKLINRVQSYFELEPSLQQIGGQLVFKILMLQTKAVCKLLQKNNYRKNAYRYQFFAQLIHLCQRNMAIMYSSLLDKMKSFYIVWNIYDEDQSFIRKMGVKFFRFKTNSEKQFKKYLNDFFQILLQLYLFIVINKKRYQCQREKIDSYLADVRSFTAISSMKNLRFLLLQTSLRLYLGIQDYQNNRFIQSQKNIESTIESCLQSLVRVNVKYTDHQKDKKIKRHFQNKLYKLLALSFVCSIKNKIELSLDYLAQQQIKLFFSLLKNLQSHLLYTRRMLAIDILNFQAFITYRQEKSEIIAIIYCIFEGKDILQNFEPKKTSKQTITDFFNEKMYDLQKHNKQKQSKTQTANKKNQDRRKRTIVIETRKDTNLSNDLNYGVSLKKMATSFLNRSSKRQSSFRRQTNNNFFIADIFSQIDKFTGNFMSSRSIRQTYRTAREDKQFYMPRNLKSTSNFGLKTARFTQRRQNALTVHKNKNDKNWKLQRPIPVQNARQTYRRDLDYTRFEKQRLKGKKLDKSTTYTTNVSQEFINVEQIRRQIEAETNILLATNRRAQLQVIEKQENEKVVEQKNIKNISHSDWFMSLVIKNKEYLGIKKLVQKIQYAKKKKQLRQKARGSRNQSIDATMRGLKKYSYIASELLKHSMYFGIDDNNMKTYRPNFRNSEQEEKLRELNFGIGQNTISHLSKIIQQNLEKHKARQQKQRRKLTRKPLKF